MGPPIHSCIIARDSNVVVVDFAGKPEPPAPQFPGANALRELAAAAPESELQSKPLRWFEHLPENRGWAFSGPCSTASGGAATAIARDIRAPSLRSPPSPPASWRQRRNCLQRRGPASPRR